MFNGLKTQLRDLLPKRYQVPAKYWYGRLSGALEEEMKFLPLVGRSGRSSNRHWGESRGLCVSALGIEGDGGGFRAQSDLFPCAGNMGSREAWGSSAFCRAFQSVGFGKPAYSNR